MKAITLITLIFCFTTIFAHQKKTYGKLTINVPLYHADAVIHSLMKTVLSRIKSKNSWFVLKQCKGSDEFYYQVIEVQHSLQYTNFYISDYFPVKGYCKQNDYMLFVLGESENPQNFFIKKNTKKKFKFRWKTTSTSKQLLDHSRFSALYKYQKGHFIYGLDSADQSFYPLPKPASLW